MMKAIIPIQNKYEEFELWIGEYAKYTQVK